MSKLDKAYRAADVKQSKAIAAMAKSLKSALG